MELVRVQSCLDETPDYHVKLSREAATTGNQKQKKDAAAKPSKPGNAAVLPTIAPYVVSWKNLDDTHINDENVWNFEKRVDSK
ncbi:hypothetical protein TELCIR_11507, partial [Teladorsagia circumcincta]